MTLSLDHNARLNLAVMLGMLECGTLAETRAAWKLMDLFALSEEEKQAIGFTVQTVNGNEAYGWRQDRTLPVREYDLSESEAKQVNRALNACPRYFPAQSRYWLEPLLTQMENGNGQPAELVKE